MYDLFKFIHVAAVIVWLGSGAAFVIMNTRMAAASDRAGIVTLTRQSEWFGKAIFGPAAGTTLVAGVVTVLLSNGAWSFGDVWVSYGFVGIVLSLVFGAVFSRRAGNELVEVATDGADSAKVAALQRRLNLYGIINLVILFSVVAVMIAKPGL